MTDEDLQGCLPHIIRDLHRDAHEATVRAQQDLSMSQNVDNADHQLSLYLLLRSARASGEASGAIAMIKHLQTLVKP